MPRAVYNHQKLRGKTRPKYVCRKISLGRKGIKFTDEHCRNLSIALVGKVDSEKTKKKKSAHSRWKTASSKQIAIWKQEARERGKQNAKTTGFKKGHIPWNKNIPLPEWMRIKVSNSCKGREAWNTGLTKETDERVAKQAEKMKGINNPAKRQETKEKIRKTLKLYHQNNPGIQARENNNNWVDGRSRIIYSEEFGYRLKLEIRKRYNFTCQLCGLLENGKAHPVHHIDYNKKNNHPLNLILLCQPCNNKVNIQRKKWQFFFEILQEIRSWKDEQE